MASAQTRIHVADGGFAGGASAFQSGVAEGFQVGGADFDDILPGVGRKKALADTGKIRFAFASGSGTVNLYVTKVKLVEHEVAVAIILFLKCVAVVLVVTAFPGVAHGVWGVRSPLLYTPRSDKQEKYMI